MTESQKRRLRRRLKNVDSVVATLNQSGVEFDALDHAMRMPLESEMSPAAKYWVESKRFKGGVKPIHWVPKWTKIPHPRKWQPSFIHEPSSKPEKVSIQEYEAQISDVGSSSKSS